MKKRKTLVKAGCGVLLVVLAVAVVVGIGMYRLWSAFNIEGAYFDSAGTRIHYVDQGSGTPVVLIHGLASNVGANWMVSGVLPKLAKHHRVIALDMRGHGRTDKPHEPEAYGMALVEDVPRLLDHLGIEKAHVAGYSMGGFIAIKLAAEHPDRLLSVSPCGSGWSPDPDKDLQFLKDLADALDRGEGFYSLLDRLKPVGKTPSEARRASINAALTDMNDTEALSAMLRSVDELMVSEKELRSIDVPMRLFCGERDPLRTVAESLLAVRQDVSLIIIPESDHLSTVKKQGLVDGLLEFIDSQDSQTADEPAAIPEAA